MGAIGVMEFGGPEQLRFLAAAARAGTRRGAIRDHAAAVNPSDALLRAGNGFAAPMLRERKPPYIPGMDAVGSIDELGANADGRLAVRDRVIAFALPTAAEAVRTRTRSSFPMPRSPPRRQDSISLRRRRSRSTG
jgi:NADPH2:quinone reductase